MKTELKIIVQNVIGRRENSIRLIGHSLGGFSLLHRNSEEVKETDSFDDGYLDLDKILTLDVELEETKNYIKSNYFGLRCSISLKKNLKQSIIRKYVEKAVRQSYHWNF